jgi:Tfp pilus assembly PilM family ATPase
MALERGKSKSKLSKPNVKQKQMQYRIEVNANSVKVVKVDAKGKIAGSGSAVLSGDPMWADKAWIDRLSQTIKKVANEAKVPKGSNFACSVITGGPNVVMQRFTWPELNHHAMLENAKHEIASYLPGTQAQFVIGAEVQCSKAAEGDKAATMDVFVAALQRDVATAISTAVAWAGFKVVSLDICENARLRLVSKYCRIDSGTPASFGMLDLNSESPNITLYLNNNFYSTHYFSAGIEATASLGSTVEDMESRAAGGSGDPVKEYNLHAVIGEINFLLDYIRYQERGSNIECILMMGSIQPDFVHGLSSSLAMPVYSTDLWMASDVISGVKGDRGKFLDVYASGIPSTVIANQHMLDLKTPPIIKNPMRRIAFTAIAGLSVMLTLLAIGLFIPFYNEQRLQGVYDRLDDEAARVNQIVADAPTQERIDLLRNTIATYNTRLLGIHNFYAEFAQASEVVPIIFETRFSKLSSMSASGDTISVSVDARYFDHTAELLEYLRRHPLFWYAGTSSVSESDTKDWVSGTSSFSLEIIMRRGMGGFAR